MSYCCGASMIGFIGSLRKQQVLVHHVPLLYCPVCHDVSVNPSVRDEFELVVEHANQDRVKEVTLRDEITPDMINEWRTVCVSFQEDDDFLAILYEQIDSALDLLRVAKIIQDKKWSEELKFRLKVLTERLKTSGRSEKMVDR
ncbi:hypothetical protein IC620_00360 [Hazenella sp. IB182357]|uniref:YgiT-type zinc finger protein n=1 Tax=Polycladospora coralii TaxID=2771432 RepID=A0A926N7W5_9BACL|nr:hypothetical protein [Polycladospora coralii]MBD1370812.1 hypothetical protein [Polycladospora coralii]